MAPERTVHTVHVSLTGAEPEVWRLVEADGTLPLDRFHRVLQTAMGWTDSHLHQFLDRDPYVHGFAEAVSWQMQDSLADGMEGRDERSETVAGALAAAGGTLWYEYDFGDGWLHELQQVPTRPAAPGEPEAAVLDGAGACPLEDSGGIDGWAGMLEIHRGGGRDDPDRDLKAEWLAEHDGPWTPLDPERFDAAEADAAVRFELSGPDPRAAVVSARPDAGGRPARSLFPRGTSPSVAADWLATLPPYPAALFAAALRRAGLDPLAPGRAPALPEGFGPAVEPFRRLVEACDGDGLPLTDAHYLTPAALRALIERLEWQDEDMVAFGGKRERDVFSILMFRKAAAAAGLVRRTGKRLVATAAGRKAAQDDGALWVRLAGRALAGEKRPVVRDATMLHALAMAAPRRPTSAAARRAVNEGLDLVGYAYPSGEPIRPDDYVQLAERWSGLMRGLDVRRRGKRKEPWQARVEAEFARAALASPAG